MIGTYPTILRIDYVEECEVCNNKLWKFENTADYQLISDNFSRFYNIVTIIMLKFVKIWFNKAFIGVAVQLNSYLKFVRAYDEVILKVNGFWSLRRVLHFWSIHVFHTDSH